MFRSCSPPPFFLHFLLDSPLPIQPLPHSQTFLIVGISLGIPLWKAGSPSFPKTSSANSPFTRGKGSWAPPLCHARILTGLILCRSYAGSHNCYVFMRAMVVSWPKDIIVFQSSWISNSYNLATSSSTMIPKPSWKDSDIDTAFVAKKSSDFFSAPVVSYCISQHPFPNETSQMNHESFSDLWV